MSSTAGFFERLHDLLTDMASDLAELEKIVDDILTAHRLSVADSALRLAALTTIDAGELASWCEQRFRLRQGAAAGAVG